MSAGEWREELDEGEGREKGTGKGGEKEKLGE